MLVDENQHVDREGARRAGVGFYGKNTMLITREHGSWVVLGTLVTDVEIEPTPPLELDCGRCRLCIDACPTGALDEPGVLDSTRCLSYWTQAPAPVPEEYRAELGASVYGCDICQDVCPWNRGIEKRRAGRRAAGGVRRQRLPRRLADAGRRRARARARPPLRPAERPSLAPAQRAATPPATRGAAALAPLAEQWAASDDPVLADAARWASARLRVVLNHDMTSDPLRVLAHELRSPVAALAAIAEGYVEADARTPAAAARARRCRRREHRAARRRRGCLLARARADRPLGARPGRRRRSGARGPAGRRRGRGRALRRRRRDSAAAGARQPHRQRGRPRAGRDDRAGHGARGTRARSWSRSPTRGRACAPDEMLRIFEPGVRATESRARVGPRPRGRARRRTRARGQGGGAVEPRRGGDVQARAAGRFRRALTPSSCCSALARVATIARASAGSSDDRLAAVAEHLGEEPLVRLVRQVARSPPCR